MEHHGSKEISLQTILLSTQDSVSTTFYKPPTKTQEEVGQEPIDRNGKRVYFFPLSVSFLPYYTTSLSQNLTS